MTSKCGTNLTWHNEYTAYAQAVHSLYDYFTFWDQNEHRLPYCAVGATRTGGAVRSVV